jgi:hypothetical protein
VKSGTVVLADSHSPMLEDVRSLLTGTAAFPSVSGCKKFF